MYIGEYRNRKGKRYIKVIRSNVERIKVKNSKEENQKYKKLIEESKKQIDIKNEIFELIDDYIYSGKPTLELIEKLNAEERFEKYGIYFANWIEDRNYKYQLALKTIESEKKLGKSNKEILEKICSNHRLRMQKKKIRELLMKDNDNIEKGIEHE